MKLGMVQGVRVKKVCRVSRHSLEGVIFRAEDGTVVRAYRRVFKRRHARQARLLGRRVHAEFESERLQALRLEREERQLEQWAYEDFMEQYA